MSKKQDLLRSVTGAAVLAAVVVLVVVIAAGGTASQERVVIGGLVNLSVVLGLQIFAGTSNVVNLGHISFMAVGAYVGAVLATSPAIKATLIGDAPFGLAEVELSTPMVLVATLVVVAVFASVSGLAVTRQVGISATIVSLALLVITHNVLLNWTEMTRGARAFYGIPLTTTLTTALALSVVGILVARLFRDSSSGLQLRAAGEDPLAAASMGVSLRRLRWVAWVLGSSIIGLAGMLYGSFLGTISPDTFYFHTTFLTLAMLLLGGSRSVSGAVVGSVFVTAGYELMRNFESGATLGPVDIPVLPGLASFFLGAVIVLVMIFKPNGLVGDDEIDERVRRRIQRRGSAYEGDSAQIAADGSPSRSDGEPVGAPPAPERRRSGFKES